MHQSPGRQLVLKAPRLGVPAGFRIIQSSSCSIAKLTSILPDVCEKAKVDSLLIELYACSRLCSVSGRYKLLDIFVSKTNVVYLKRGALKHLTTQLMEVMTLSLNREVIHFS